MQTLKPVTVTVAFALVAAFASAQDYRVEQPFMNHVQVGANEQDVFVADGDAVYRVAADAEASDAMLFSSAVAVTHNPADATDLGPFPKGQPLGITQNEWLAARGDITVSCAASSGELRASFEKLVPNAIYTLWQSYIVMPMTVPFRVLDIPVGALDGSQNAFSSDNDGNADVAIPLEQCVPISQDQLATAVSLAYHSDGQTYGLNPGAFGKNSHVQLFTFLPTRAQLEEAQAQQ